MDFYFILSILFDLFYYKLPILGMKNQLDDFRPITRILMWGGQLYKSNKSDENVIPFSISWI